MTRPLMVIAAAALGAALAAGCETQDQNATPSASPTAHEHAPASKQPAGDQAAVDNGFDAMPEEGTKAHCPVMDHEFTVKKDSPTVIHQGKTYVFCCEACVPKFEAEPDEYIKS